jgi:hypothetical protein
VIADVRGVDALAHKAALLQIGKLVQHVGFDVNV